MNLLGISIFWWLVVLVVIIIFFCIRAYKSRKERSSAEQHFPKPKVQTKTKRDKEDEDEEDEDEDKPKTWEKIQDLVEFGEHYAIGGGDDLVMNDLDLLFKHGWELFLVDDYYYYFKKKISV
jgi:hypothetical protein